MLIQALAEYYDILENEGKITSDEYSSINIDYIVCLTECGTIDHIIECEKNTVEIMPKRSEKPGICSNIIEHRALYVFGLNFDKGVFRQRTGPIRPGNHIKILWKRILILSKVSTRPLSTLTEIL